MNISGTAALLVIALCSQNFAELEGTSHSGGRWKEDTDHSGGKWKKDTDPETH